ncbi:MAG: right-handed parallel beta-helix repeat-containing protein [Methylococcales bacterium]
MSSKYTLAGMMLLLLVAHVAHATNLKVNCDKGGTLAKALAKARPGMTIQITGTCHEAVTITTNRLTLDGGGIAILDGGGQQAVVTIQKAHAVTLQGLTIRNGNPRGIFARLGVTMTLRNVIVEQCTIGVEMDGAQARVIDSTLQENSNVGFVALHTSTVEILGDVVSQHNGFGIAIGNGSAAFVPLGGQGTLTAHDNGQDGVVLIAGSALSLQGPGASLIAHHNGGSGLLVATNSSVAIVFGGMLDLHDNQVHGLFLAASSALSASDGLIKANANGQDGIHVEQSAAFGVSSFLGLTPLFPAVETQHNGRHGLSASIGSAIGVSQATLTSQQNAGSGLFADDGSTVSLVGSPGTPITVTQNGGGDVVLSFAARATLVGSTIGAIACDATALSRGTTVCP